MKKFLVISSVLLGVVFLAGCGQQPVSQTQPTTPASVAQQPKQPTDETASWQTYRNEKQGFEFKYPKTLELASASEAGGLIPFDPLIISSVYVIQPDSKDVIFSVDVKGSETLTPTWVAMQSDALKPATLQPAPVPVVIAGVSGYKIAKDTIAITTDFPQGTKYASDQYFLQKTGGPIFNLVIPGDSGGQILSTFKFTK